MPTHQKRTFLLMTDFGEILDLGIHLQDIEGQHVLMHIFNRKWRRIGKGIIEQVDDWFSYIGEGVIWVFDGCEHGKMQDWLREQGEIVFGGSEVGDEMENDRQLGQDLFKAAGFKQPESNNFSSIEEAIAFVTKHNDRRWILKQNGSAPKSINHMGKFDDGSDMVWHLEQLKKSWNEAEFGRFDCDLMEVVQGTEVAASAFWNGEDWMRDKSGKVVGFLNCEEKKECDGGMGETTGELGTTFLGVDETNKLFADIMLRPEIAKWLKSSGFRGVFDINGTLLESGDYAAFEPTCRFGIPTTSYVFTQGLKSGTAELIEAVADGNVIPIEIQKGVGMVLVVVAKPFPLEEEAHIESPHTSLGDRLWLMDKGVPVDEMTAEHMSRIHLYNFSLDDDAFYRVATDCGYMLTVTGIGETVEGVRDEIMAFVKNSVYLPGMKHRTDIGKRAQDLITKNA